jgi:hypothetical protein
LLDKPPVSICVLPEYNLKIEYPINWIKLDRKNLPDPINIAFMSPPPKGTPFSITESEGLFLSIMHPQSGRKTLENWVNGDMESMKLQFPDFTIHDSFPRTISSTDGQTTPAYQLPYLKCLSYFPSLPLHLILTTQFLSHMKVVFNYEWMSSSATAEPENAHTSTDSL